MPTGNLPSELTSFVGRRSEVTDVKQQLADARLVTLTGIGGSGKTRLAIRAATQVRRAFRNRVWFIDLTELHEPAEFAQQARDVETLAYLIAATLGIRGHEREPLRLLVEQLAGLPTLLVVDNCEHLIPACAAVVDRLLRGCPELRVLATSREPLAISGETLVPVPPLPLPDPRRPSPACESVALFVERGRMVLPGFDLTPDNRAAVAAICHRLDGLPLAIELAAARLRALSPDQILQRLDRRFALLNRGSQVAPERHQTLRACMAWSFELCAKPERLLWARLSVFAGGFDLDAVEGICADDALPVEELLEVVSGLMDKSILVRDDGVRSARYRMLTTIRDYGLLQLREVAEESVLRTRHATWYLRLAERAEGEWFGSDQIGWCRRVQLEYANLRAAFDFLLGHAAGRPQAVRLASSLWFYWLVFGQASEGCDWLGRAVEAATEPGPDRAKALWAHGHLATVRGDLDEATDLLHAAHDMARDCGDALTLARAAKRLGAVAMHRGDLHRAEALLTDALDRLRILDGAEISAVHCQIALMLTRFLRADLAGAVALGHQIRAACRSRGDHYLLAHALNLLARAELALGDAMAAAAHVREAIQLRRALPDAMTLMFSVDLLSWITAAAGDHERAATLAGAAQSLWQSSGSSVHRWQFVGEPRSQWETRIRRALGDANYEAALRRGAEFTVDDIIAYALEGRTAPARKRAGRGPGTVLTDRERQIAELVAEGRSNKEIAAQLVISRRTAESHVEHILQKLAFTSRSQIAAWVQRTPDEGPAG
jgi:predicted ATPase/DNA-binding CsgD family transcriptional regulator